MGATAGDWGVASQCIPAHGVHHTLATLRHISVTTGRKMLFKAAYQANVCIWNKVLLIFGAYYLSSASTRFCRDSSADLRRSPCHRVADKGLFFENVGRILYFFSSLPVRHSIFLSYIYRAQGRSGYWHDHRVCLICSTWLSIAVLLLVYASPFFCNYYPSPP